MSATMLTAQEVAVRMKVSIDTVRTLIGSGALDAEDWSATGKRHQWRISEEALQKFRESRSSAESQPVVRRSRPKTPAGVKQFF
jgi:excisionase family DNA binding protein